MRKPLTIGSFTPSPLPRRGASYTVTSGGAHMPYSIEKHALWCLLLDGEALPQAVMGTLPRGFNREQSAEYVGVFATKFDQMVADGRMPKPKRIDGRVVWDRLQLDSAFAALPDEDGRGDVWSKIAV